jgi:hypothetical protein
MWKENTTVWPWSWRKDFPLKPWYSPTRLHDVITNTTITYGVFVKFLFQWLWWWENGGSSRKFGRSTENHQKSSWEVSSTKPPTSCNAVENQNSGTLTTNKLEIYTDNCIIESLQAFVAGGMIQIRVVQVLKFCIFVSYTEVLEVPPLSTSYIIDHILLQNTKDSWIQSLQTKRWRLLVSLKCNCQPTILHSTKTEYSMTKLLLLKVKINRSSGSQLPGSRCPNLGQH